MGVAMKATCDQLPPTAAASDFTGRIYLCVAAAAASLALSLWGGWAQFVPNPDASLYLRSAELFAGGHWSAGLATFGWPLYSLLIAGVMKLTGLEALLAAQVVNASFSVVTTLAFIGLVGQLSRDRLVMLCAAIVIVLQPLLVAFRPSIIRDNCYLAFFVLTLYLVARDSAAPRLWTKLAIAASVLTAGLFRIEGFALAALVPIYFIARSSKGWRRPSVIIAIVLAGLLAVPGLLLWNTTNLGQWLSGHVDLGNQLPKLSGIYDVIAGRLNKLRYDVLFPYGGGNVWGAYIGMVLGIAVVNIVRAITIPLAILTTFAFYPRRLMPRSVSEFVLWFAFGQLPVLLLFTFWTLLLDKRYAAAMALVLDIPLAFLLAEAVRRWRSEVAARIFLPIAAVTLVVTWGFSVPRPSKLGYLKEAGRWIAHEVPATAKVLTNDFRVSYFSRRPYGESMGLWAPGFREAPTDQQLATYDYFVLQVEGADKLPPAIASLPDKELVRTFPGKDGASVIVLRRNRPGAAIGDNVK